MCAAQRLTPYYDTEDLCGEERQLKDEEMAALDVVHIEYTVGTVWDRKGGIETSALISPGLQDRDGHLSRMDWRVLRS